jgi:glycosyltransferase involved in cell wall biosynthesis
MVDTRKISVMQLVYSLQMGGSEKVALDIALHLDADRFESSVSALDLNGDLARELESAHIPHHVFHRKGLEPGVFKRIYQWIAHRRIDVVHTHHFTQLLFAALPARLAGARIVHTEHEFFSYTQSAVPRTLIRPLARLCDAMTVVGPEVADYFVRTIGIPRERLTIVPNGVDVGTFDYDADAARRELGLEPGELVIGTVGRLEPEKDQITLLDVFRQVRATHKQARLVIVGDGRMADELKAHAERIGVAGATLFLGYRRDVAKLLAAMDVFVLTSIREGLPISLIEAMAARRPVVASNIGSVRDLVQDGDNGLVVPARDTGAFSGAVERLIQSPELRQTLAEAGRRTVEASFSLPAVIKAYENLYRSSMKKTHVWN